MNSLGVPKRFVIAKIRYSASLPDQTYQYREEYKNRLLYRKYAVSWSLQRSLYVQEYYLKFYISGGDCLSDFKRSRLHGVLALRLSDLQGT